MAKRKLKLHQRTYFGLRHTSIVIPEDQRPKCQYCGKPLKPETWSVWILERFEGPAQEEHFEKVRRELKKALAWSRVEIGGPTTFDSSGVRTISVWTGQYQGYQRDAKGVTLFCNGPHAMAFAESAYRGGYRMPDRQTGELITRVYPDEGRA